MILGFKTKFDDGTPTMFVPKIVKSFFNSNNSLIDSEFIFLDQDYIDSMLMDYDFNSIVPKIHSIRAGKRFKPGMIIHMATGVRTKNYHCFAKVKCVSVQDIKFLWHPDRATLHDIEIDNISRYDEGIGLIISENDGLKLGDFFTWFFKASETVDVNNQQLIELGCKQQKEFNGQIVHWTNFKY